MSQAAHASEAGQRRIRRWPAVVLLSLVLLLGLYLLRVPLLVGVARLVSVEDPLRRADFIYLLNGGGSRMARAVLAADLFARGLAPRVVIARAEGEPASRFGLYPNDTDVNIAILRRAGVPREAIVMLRTPGGVTSTTDEARVLRTYLARRPAERVIVVTSDFHTARARWNLRRALEGVPVEVLMAGATERINERNWWKSEEGLIRYFTEYAKFAHNWIYR